jgi:hypothetical protein
MAATIRVAGEALAITAVRAALIGYTVERLSVRSTEQAFTLPHAAAARASRIGSGSDNRVDGAVSRLRHASYTNAFHAVLTALAVLAALAAVVYFMTPRTPAANKVM